MITSSSYFDLVSANCQRHGILFDTEILLVICVGIFDPQRISKFKKTTAYNLDDFNMLKRVADRYKLYISPQILAELSNHSDRLDDNLISEYYRPVKEFIRTHFEVYIPKDELLDEECLPKLGFADTSMLKICLDKKCVLFTADWKLTDKCRHYDIKVFNFKEYRESIW